LFLTIFFIAGLFWLPGSGWIWTAAALGILAFPTYVSFSSDLLNRPARVRWKLYMEKVRDNLRINTVQAISTIIIVLTSDRHSTGCGFPHLIPPDLFKKWLLEWATASHAEKLSPNSLGVYFRLMLIPVLLGILPS
jgi:cyclic beta-1,2-glucan synthetase